MEAAGGGRGRARSIPDRANRTVIVADFRFVVDRWDYSAEFSPLNGNPPHKPGMDAWVYPWRYDTRL
jgi:hypothetical protein